MEFGHLQLWSLRVSKACVLQMPGVPTLMVSDPSIKFDGYMLDAYTSTADTDPNCAFLFVGHSQRPWTSPLQVLASRCADDTGRQGRAMPSLVLPWSLSSLLPSPNLVLTHNCLWTYLHLHLCPTEAWHKDGHLVQCNYCNYVGTKTPMTAGVLYVCHFQGELLKLLACEQSRTGGVHGGVANKITILIG